MPLSREAGPALPRRGRTLILAAMVKLRSLLALVALLVASVSMAAAPAAAAAPHHGATASMPVDHCPDEDGTAEPTGAMPECAMACSAALPAADLAQAEALTIPRTAPNHPLARSLAGVVPDIATPPPKRS